MRFWFALAGGFVASFLAATWLQTVDLSWNWLDWINHNLGVSAPLFMLVSVVTLITLFRLRAGLSVSPINQARVAHLEQRIDLAVGLLFGIGVLYTAFGIREALVAALSIPAQESASGVLTALVNGGILSAMTSTVVGGVMGYGMRLVKLFMVSEQLEIFYTKLDTKEASDREKILQEILNSLRSRRDDRGC